jgi:hypothetical protein
MNDLTNRIEPVATKNFRIKRSNGDIVKGKVHRARRSFKPHVWDGTKYISDGITGHYNTNPILQFRPFFEVIYKVGGGDVMSDLATGSSLDQTLEAIKDVAFSDAIDGFIMECGDSVTFE